MAELRARWVPFDEAWPLALARTLRSGRYGGGRDRATWRTIFEEQRPVWEHAYHGEGDPDLAQH